jgi:hypothetical protein
VCGDGDTGTCTGTAKRDDADDEGADPLACLYPLPESARPLALLRGFTLRCLGRLICSCWRIRLRPWLRLALIVVL